jgi:pimeloyl-ACP methyl ester carboxylesterase
MVTCPPLPKTIPDQLPTLERLECADGVSLCYEAYGEESDPAVLFAHGFGQTRHAWGATAEALARCGFACYAMDGRGHGDSGWSPDGQYRLAHFIDDARSLAAKVGSRPVWVGASMGGLVGLMAEATTPGGLFSALVLVDITPRWEAEGVARIMTFMRARPEGFTSLEEAQAAVVSYLPHRARAKSPQRLAKLLVRAEDGRYRWHWDPRLLDTIAHEAPSYLTRLNEAAQRLRLPVLLVSGGRSDVVSDATIAEFRQLVPHAEHVRIPHATHMVTGDDNARFSAEIAAYLKRLESIPAPSRRSS